MKKIDNFKKVIAMRKMNKSIEMHNIKTIAYKVLKKLGYNEKQLKLKFAWNSHYINIIASCIFNAPFTFYKMPIGVSVNLQFSEPIWPYLTKEHKEYTVAHEVCHAVSKFEDHTKGIMRQQSEGHGSHWTDLMERAGYSLNRGSLDNKGLVEDIIKEFGQEKAETILDSGFFRKKPIWKRLYDRIIKSKRATTSSKIKEKNMKRLIKQLAEVDQILTKKVLIVEADMKLLHKYSKVLANEVVKVQANYKVEAINRRRLFFVKKLLDFTEGY